MHCWRHRTPIIYRATTQWFAGMDDVPGYHGVKPAATLRSVGTRGDRGDAILPVVGQVAPLRNDRQPPGLDVVATAAVGNADPVFRRQANGSAAPRYAGAARARGRQGRDAVGSSRGSSRRTRTSASIRTSTASSPIRSTSGSTRASTHQTVLRHDPRAALSGRPLSRRLRPASRLVPLVAAHLVDAQRHAAVQGAAHARFRGRRQRQEDVQVQGQRRRAAEGVERARRGNPATMGGRHRLFRRPVDFR